MCSLFGIWSKEPKEAPVCASIKSYGCVLFTKGRGTIGLVFQRDVSGDADPIQDSQAGMAKVLLPTTLHRLVVFCGAWFKNISWQIYGWRQEWKCASWQRYLNPLTIISVPFVHNCSDCGGIHDHMGKRLTHSSDSIPMPHYCLSFWFSYPLYNFSESSCKADTFFSWTLKKMTLSVKSSFPCLGWG